MTAQYTLSEDDHLTYQLYERSRSQQFKKIAKRGSIPVLFFLILASTLSIKTMPVMAVIYAGAGLAYYFLFPSYIRSRQSAYLLGAIRERSRKLIERPIQVELTDETFFVKFGSTETRTPLRDLEKIVELPTLVTIEFQSGQTVALPKHQNAETDAIIEELKEFGRGIGARYVDKLDWKWNKRNIRSISAVRQGIKTTRP